MSSKKYTHIFWDWNGTLINDALISLKALNIMHAKRGLKEITIDYFRTLEHTPLYGLFKKLFSMNMADFDSFEKEYSSLYNSLSAEMNLNEGAKEKLAEYKNTGIKQVILTSTWTSSVEEFTASLEVRNYFEAILGANSLEEGNKIERAGKYMERNNIGKKEIVLIGDSTHDVEVARELGIECFLTSSGYQAKDILLEKTKGLDNVKVFDNLMEINIL